MTLTNEAATPAEYIVANLLLDSRLQVVDAADLQLGNTTAGASVIGQNIPVQLLQASWGIPGKLPVWQGVNFRFIDRPLKIALPNQQPGHYLIGWTLQSPRMPTKHFFQLLIFNGAAVFLRNAEG